MSNVYVKLLHILFTGPLLIYVGLMKPPYDWVYWMLFILGLYVLVEFGKWVLTTKWTEHHIWGAVHMLLLAPLLLYVGWMKTATPNTVYSLMLAVGIAAFGYHFLRLVQKNLQS